MYLAAGGAGLFLVAVLLVILCFRGGSRPEDAHHEAQGEEEPDLVLPAPPPLSPQQIKINEAVKRGVAYLKTRVRYGSRLYSDGEPEGGDAHVGAVALAGLTLLECGVPPEDPALRQALFTVRTAAPRMTSTYCVAAAILFLDRVKDRTGQPLDPGDPPLIRSMAFRLIAGQNVNGGWTYYCQVLQPALERNLLAQLQANWFVPGNFFVPGQMNMRDDNSIGQFATLALWTARRHGVPVQPSLRAVDWRYRKNQNGNGSWDYVVNFPSFRDTSTCAGLIGLAVAHGVEDEEVRPPGNFADKVQGKPAARDILEDPVVKKGLRYLGQVIGKKSNLSDEERTRRHKHTADIESILAQMETASEFERKELKKRCDALKDLRLFRGGGGILFGADDMGDLYFLWSIERTAVIYDLKTIEGKDWYEWGSEIILANQDLDGSWRERFPGVPDTCFALLFLKRANVVKDQTDKLRRLLAGGGVEGVPADPQNAPFAPTKRE